jgi:hypothetical protein
MAHKIAQKTVVFLTSERKNKQKERKNLILIKMRLSYNTNLQNVAA